MQLSRRHICAYVAIAALVVAVGVRYVIKPGASGAAGGQALVLAPASPAASGAASSAASSARVVAASPSSAAADVVVYVCGAVKAPGIVRVPAGARVTDALELAGGPSARAELTAVNLAAKVSDGEQIVVPARGQSAPAVAATAGAATVAGPAVPAAPVNINTATAEQLDALVGVGPATAQKIIDYRVANGPFKTIDDIKNVSGIGDAKFAAMKDNITV